MPCVTSGTQKWNGAIPSFIAKAIVMSIEATGLNSFITVHWPENIRLMMTDRKSTCLNSSHNA